MSSTITRLGSPIQVGGQFPQVGMQLPADLTFVNRELADVTLNDFGHCRKILNIFPSIDTPTCAMSVRAFNQKAASLNNAVVLCISADLPFAQSRFCGAEGIDNVQTLSTFRFPSVAEQLGVAILDSSMAGLTARAVIVLDEENRVLHSELVSELKSEPNYAAALAVLA